MVPRVVVLGGQFIADGHFFVVLHVLLSLPAKDYFDAFNLICVFRYLVAYFSYFPFLEIFYVFNFFL
jgi:hypothetical protein